MWTRAADVYSFPRLGYTSQGRDSRVTLPPHHAEAIATLVAVTGWPRWCVLKGRT